ncbi:GNAT family N-acetyltransferase [Mesorhizobium sp. CAU 1741]|uniref:GNAT family N-acetyltransferase n=1 Tax=Mesorhizobium sp. CAU 1741 TaxID=3140366 RepID=UPI00325C1ED1
MPTLPLRETTTDWTVNREERFDFLSPEYRVLYEAHGATAFQSPLWQHMLHDRFLPEIAATQATVVVRRTTGGEPIAVIPLVSQRSHGVAISQFADFGVCDYNAPVGDSAELTHLAADPLFREQLRKTFKGSDVVMFRKVRSDGFDMSRLLDASKSSAGENAGYECEIGNDFDHWRSRVLNKKFTKELGRLQRQAEREHGSYEHRTAVDEREIRAAFEFLREAQIDRQKASPLSKKTYFDFYSDFAVAGASRGDAITYVSYLAGEPIAVLFGPAGKGQFHPVLIGADTNRFARMSAGNQIIYRLIQQRLGEGHTHFDMGLGDPGYKQHFRPTEMPMRNTTRSLTPTGAAISLIYHHSKPLKNILRELVPNVR